MRLTTQHIKTGRDRCWLRYEGPNWWHIEKTHCPKEARAITDHLMGLNPSDETFMTQANTRLAAIGFRIRPTGTPTGRT